VSCFSWWSPCSSRQTELDDSGFQNHLLQFYLFYFLSTLACICWYKTAQTDNDNVDLVTSELDQEQVYMWRGQPSCQLNFYFLYQCSLAYAPGGIKRSCCPSVCLSVRLSHALVQKQCVSELWLHMIINRKHHPGSPSHQSVRPYHMAARSMAKNVLESEKFALSISRKRSKECHSYNETFVESHRLPLIFRGRRYSLITRKD